MPIQENGVIRDLFRLRGKVSRQRYLVVGLVLFAVKYALDYWLTAIVFHRPWTWFPYLDPLRELHGMTGVMAVDWQYALSMLALALPFIWIGTAMTSRRLRSAGLAQWVVILFFVPIANLVTLAILCVLRERDGETAARRRISPQDASFALLIASIVCTLFVVLGTGTLMHYGVGLFIALPFCLGFLSVLIYNFDGSKGFPGCMGVAALSVVIPGVALLLFAMEGIGCLLMALPLALPFCFC
jgi:uncharacterized membrane protein YhaH (DUF805 family)